MTNKKQIKKILELSEMGYSLSLSHRKVVNQISEILEKINPELEESLRKGYSFLDTMADYGECRYSEEQIKKQIEQGIKEIR